MMTFCDINIPVKLRLQHSPPPGQPPGILTFEDWLVKIPSPWGKKTVQMPHQLVLKYLSSKTNFVLNQTLFSLFRERDVRQLHLQTSFKDPFERVTHKQRQNSIKPCKNLENSRAYYARTRDKSGSNSPPFQGNVQIPPSPGMMHSQMPGVGLGEAWGGGEGVRC